MDDEGAGCVREGLECEHAGGLPLFKIYIDSVPHVIDMGTNDQMLKPLNKNLKIFAVILWRNFFKQISKELDQGTLVSFVQNFKWILHDFVLKCP